MKRRAQGELLNSPVSQVRKSLTLTCALVYFTIFMSKNLVPQSHTKDHEHFSSQYVKLVRKTRRMHSKSLKMV